MPKAERCQGYTLRDSPLFRRRTKKKLAHLLRVSEAELIALSKRDDLYERRWKHKKLDQWRNTKPSGEKSSLYRPIDIPDPKLKKIQSRIADLLSRITPPEWLFSPVKGRSYVDNAARHKGANAFWMLDIADYFPSCSANNVAHFFHSKLECSRDVTAILVKICTLKNSLPQGSPCSPILAYYSNMDMWLDIATCVSKAGLTHSVYADDITVSGDMILGTTIWDIKRVVHKHGHRLRADKELSLLNSPADVTGVIVAADTTKLPNRQLKKLFELRNLRHVTKSSKQLRKIDQQISGRIAQLHQVEES